MSRKIRLNDEDMENLNQGEEVQKSTVTIRPPCSSFKDHLWNYKFNGRGNRDGKEVVGITAECYHCGEVVRDNVNTDEINRMIGMKKKI